MKKTDYSSKGLPWLAAMAFFMQSLDNTILNTAIPTMAASLDCTPLAMRAAVISYALTVAMLIPISGWLADRFGTKKIFILAVTLFSLGSLLCALSFNLPFLVISRIIQGVGGAMMMPVSRLAILKTYPRNELLPILNFVAIPGLVGPVLGPFLGGIIVTYSSWHWIFLINLPIGLIGLYYTRYYMPDFKESKRNFDFLGFMLFSFGLVAISVGISSLAENIISSYLSLIIILSGLCLFIGYIFYALKMPMPLIRLSLFKNRIYSIGIIGSVFSRLGISATPFLIPLMLQVGFGYSALMSGLAMAPMAMGSILGKSLITRILNKIGYRSTLIIITLSIGSVIALFSLQTPNLPLWIFIIPLMINGLLMSTQFTSINTLTLGCLDKEYASEGNSVMAVTQQLSISLGIGVSAVVYSFYTSYPGNSDVIDNFHYTFITMGIITMLSTLIFTRYKKEDGDELLKNRKA